MPLSAAKCHGLPPALLYECARARLLGTRTRRPKDLSQELAARSYMNPRTLYR